MLRVLTLLLALACAGCSAESPHEDGSRARSAQPDAGALPASADVPLGRLPASVTPLRYNLELTIDPRLERFDGHTDIRVRLDQPADHIYLHGRDLAVRDAGLYLANGERIPVEYRQVHADGVARVDFGVTVSPQAVRLEFSYDAPLSHSLNGLYGVEEGGDRYVFTQFESIFARQVFPGFDEPAFKTPFDVALIVPASAVAIANTPVVESTLLDGNRKRVRYATTPALPTYLLAFAVGPLDVVEWADIPANDVRARAVPLRGVAARGKGAQLGYALEHTGALLATIEDYFGIPYPYAKLDIIAVPDFESGAMENVGAITFRESLLLLDDYAPVTARRRYARVMAHELAHMWFGNLVTMPWWDDIWLNESFATWLSYKAVASWDPDQQPEFARLSRLFGAMREDGLTSARQIREPVRARHDIFSAFDGITYAKGGAVLTMFESFLGEQAFREGVSYHLTQFAGGNADVNDFIASLSASSGKDINAAFRSFLFQPGIPLLEVTPDCQNNRLDVVQQRYLPVGSVGDPRAVWQVPFCVRLGIDGETARQCMLLTETVSSMALPDGCGDWLLPNADFAGYYHWTLPAAAYSGLGDNLAALTSMEQMSLADSAIAGLAAGRFTVGQALAALAPLARSAEPLVAVEPLELIRYVADYLVLDEKSADGFRNYVAGLYRHVDAVLAFDPAAMAALASDSERIFYAEIASLMADVVRSPAVRAEAAQRGAAYLRMGAADGAAGGLDPDAVASVSLDTALRVLAQDGGLQAERALRRQLETSANAILRNSVIKALAGITDKEAAGRVRQLVLGPRLRSNEIRTLLLAHVKQPENRDDAWTWLQANFEALAPRMPSRHAAQLARVPQPLCQWDTADNVAAFLGARIGAYPGGPRALAKSVETIRLCASRVPMERKQAQSFFSGARLRQGQLR